MENHCLLRSIAFRSVVLMKTKANYYHLSLESVLVNSDYVTKCNRLGGLKTSNVFSPSSGDQKSKFKVSTGLLPSENSAAAAAKSLQSCPTLGDPIDGSPPGSPVPGILQARTLEWVAIPFSNA